MRLLHRRLRSTLVVLLCVALSVDPASACHWLSARWSSSCAPVSYSCGPVYSCGTPCGSNYYVATDCCGNWSSCCGEGRSDAAPAATTTDSGHASRTPTWAGADSARDRSVNKPSKPQLPPEELPPAPAVAESTQPAAITPPPMEKPAATNDELFVEESVVEEPADDLFAAPPEEPVMEEPAPPANDLFGAPAEEPAMEEPAGDDLFDAPAEEPAAGDDLFGAPAEEPAPEEPAGDDLFGAPPEDPAPADDDLFGAPAEEPADDDLFGAPAEEPAMQEPAGNDLFSAPAEEPADDADEDLFGAPAEEPDDLFGPPAGEDDLFGPPTEEPEGPAAEDPDDLFGNAETVLEQPGGLSSLALRHWVDNTGEYSVDARLIAVLDGQVRLLKANGRMTTVAFDRLSDEDLSFVNRQAAAQQAELVSQTAQR